MGASVSLNGKSKPIDQSPPSRIQYLDGLRGISISFVVMHHAFGPWNIMFGRTDMHPPLGSAFSLLSIVLYSYLAVELFFFISGYVILMTMERCSGFLQFMARRWLRLFPSMLICSLIIVATGAIFTQRPMGMPVLSALLPGLTFTEPSWWARLLHRPQPILEGAFWSLYVEMRFYIIFGLAYFVLGKRLAIATLGVIFALALAAPHLPAAPLFEAAGVLHYVNTVYALALSFVRLDGIYYGMFLSGVLFYQAQQTDSLPLRVVSALLGLISGLVLGNADFGVGSPIGGQLVGLLFMFAIPVACNFARMRQIFSSRALLFMGYISYPLYLGHQNMMVSTFLQLRQAGFNRIPLIAAVLAILLVVGVAWLVTRYAEPSLRHVLRSTARSLEQPPIRPSRNGSP